MMIIVYFSCTFKSYSTLFAIMCIDQYSTSAYADLRVKPLCHSSLCLKHIMFTTIIPMQSAHTCTHTLSHIRTLHMTQHTPHYCGMCVHYIHIRMHACTGTYRHHAHMHVHIHTPYIQFHTHPEDHCLLYILCSHQHEMDPPKSTLSTHKYCSIV